MNPPDRHPSTFRVVHACAALVMVGAAPLVDAQETDVGLNWAVDVGAARTDNVARSATNEQSETVGIAGVAFDVSAERRRLETDLSASLEYRDYLDQSFESEVVGGFDGTIGLAFVPERFIWVLEDNFGQFSANRQLPDSPANRRQINYFSTGPDFILPLGGRTSLQLSGRWSDTYLEDSPEGSESVRGSLGLVRQLSEATSISLNASASQVEFDHPELFSDYEVQQGFVRLEASGSRTTLAGDVGYSEYRQEGQSSERSLLTRIDLTRRIGARSLLGLSAGTEPSNTAETFRRDQSIGGIGVGTGAALVGGDLFQSDYGYVTWATEWVRSAFSAALSARREEHERLAELDRDQYRIEVGWSRELSRVIGIDLRGSYLEEEFTETDFTFDEWGAGGTLRWQLARQFALVARAGHFIGSSDGDSRDYTENRVYLGVSYGSGSGSSGATRL